MSAPRPIQSPISLLCSILQGATGSVPVLAALLLAAHTSAGPSAQALEMRDINMVSPITGSVFPVVVVPATQSGGEILADMGTDDDGCRHSSSACEYDSYVATDTTSYFTALTAE